MLVWCSGTGAQLDLELGQQAWRWDKREEMLLPMKKSPFGGGGSRKKQIDTSGPPYHLVMLPAGMECIRGDGTRMGKRGHVEGFTLD